jgi:hypothetical protein
MLCWRLKNDTYLPLITSGTYGQGVGGDVEKKPNVHRKLSQQWFEGLVLLNLRAPAGPADSTTSIPKKCNYELRATKSNPRLTKFLVNNIHNYVFKLIYNENIFHN